MTRELSRALLNRKYPHKIRLLAERVRLDDVIAFHIKLGITTKTRSVLKHHARYTLYCFEKYDHAQMFQALFGGEWIIRAQKTGRG